MELPARLHVKPPQSTPAQRKALRDTVRAECERRPGVYRMLGPTGIVLYVGQSRVLRTRLLSYFRAKGRRNKAARIVRHAFRIEWEYTSTEFAALLRELRLIKQHRPHFNAMMVADEWPRAYVALTGGAVPGLTVVPRSDEPSAVAMFGPFRRVSRLSGATSPGPPVERAKNASTKPSSSVTARSSPTNSLPWCYAGRSRQQLAPCGRTKRRDNAFRNKAI